MHTRGAVWQVVSGPSDAEPRLQRASQAFGAAMLALIALNVLAVIVESVPSLPEEVRRALYGFEVFSVAVFTVEYLVRLWACVEDPRYAHPVAGRLRFAVTPMALIDLFAVLPFYLPYLGADLRSLRALRLVRLFRLVKVGRYATSLGLMGRVLRKKREELVVTFGVLVLLLIVSATLMYHVEHDAQPDDFSSIPTAMWWAVATLTTIGYGDVAPVTGLGKVLGAAIAVLGIGLFALPTSILGAAFVEEIGRQRAPAMPAVCPHCGRPLDAVPVPSTMPEP